MSIDTFLLSADTTDLNYPEVRPTLDLNFARVKALDPRITFTRASGGSYVGADGLIKYAGVNEARFDHDPSTGESLGLLMEESRSNLTTYSEDFTNAAYILFGTASRSANTVTAPDGNTTADTVTLPISSGIYQFTSASASTTYTFSVWIRTASASQNVNIVLNTNLGDATQLTVTATTTWQRFSVTKTTSVGTTTLTSQLSTGGGNTFYVWGAQTEAGAFPTSYIPTQGSTRTRDADNASITGKNFSEWYRQDEYAIFSSSRTFRPNSFPAILTIDSGSPFTNSVSLYYDPSFPRGGTYWRNSGVLFGFNGTTLSSIKDINTKLCILIKSNDRVFAQNGSLQSLTTGFGFPPTGAIRLVIGAGDTPLNGTIARLTYYPKRLSNAQLQALTR